MPEKSELSRELPPRLADLLCGGLATAIGALYLLDSVQMPYPSCVFPIFCAAWLTSIGLLIFLRAIALAHLVPPLKCTFPLQKTWVIIATIILLACAFETVGFFASSFLFIVLVSTFIIGSKRTFVELLKNCVVVAIFLAILYFVFVFAMEVQLPDTIAF